MLVRLFTGGEFEDRCHSSMSSKVYHKNFEFDGRSVSLQVIDDPGLTSIPTLDLAQGAGVIAVYDITNRISFTQLSTWLLRSKNQCPDGSPILLIGNKLDWEHSTYGGPRGQVKEARRLPRSMRVSFWKPRPSRTSTLTLLSRVWSNGSLPRERTVCTNLKLARARQPAQGGSRGKA